MHTWQLDEKTTILEAHIDMDEDIKISEFEGKLEIIKEILLAHGINHVNIQPEINTADSKALVNKS